MDITLFVAVAALTGKTCPRERRRWLVKEQCPYGRIALCFLLCWSDREDSRGSVTLLLCWSDVKDLRGSVLTDGGYHSVAVPALTGKACPVKSEVGL